MPGGSGEHFTIMTYISPFEILRGKVRPKGNGAAVPTSRVDEGFLSVLERGRTLADVDDAWDLKSCTDVQRTIKSGITQSPRRHFPHHG